MANLAASGVTISRQFRNMGTGGNNELVIDATIVLSSMGTATNKVLASAFQLTAFIEGTVFTKSDNTEVIVAVPSADKSFLLLKAAGTNAPADFSGTYTARVKGY